MKKTLSILTSWVLMLSISHKAEAYDFSVVAPSGQMLYYNIVNHGVEIVSNYPDFPSGNLVIPPSVTHEGNIYTVVGIGEGAFWTASSLTGTITLPNTITYIGDLAFYRCSGILSLEIPSSVTSIGFHAFEGVNNVVYGGNLQDNANWYAKTLNGYIENGLVYTDSTKSIVTGCDHTYSSYVIPSSVTALGPRALAWHNSMSHITLPESLTSIGMAAFAYCGALESISLPSSLTEIGFGAFASDTLLQSLTIPANVTHVGNMAFQMCNALDTLYMLGGIPPIYDTLYVEYYEDGDSSVWLDNYTMVDITINVPCHAGTAYRSAAGWSMCSNIVDPCDDDNPNGVNIALQPKITITASDGTILVQGIDEETSLNIYDIMGRTVAITTSIGTQCTIAVPHSGLYMVKVNNHAARKVFVLKDNK